VKWGDLIKIPLLGIGSGVGEKGAEEHGRRGENVRNSRWQIASQKRR